MFVKSKPFESNFFDSSELVVSKYFNLPVFGKLDSITVDNQIFYMENHVSNPLVIHPLACHTLEQIIDEYLAT